MASPLHDNPRSKSDKKEEKKPDEKPEEKAAVEKKAAEKPKEPDAAEKPEEAGEAEPSKKDMFMDGMKAIQKRHESERRDFHGNHREAMRQMANRHSKEIADHFDLSLGDHGEEKNAEPAESASDS
jgi:hypothetical protein